MDDEVFVGRADELARFRVVLAEFLAHTQPRHLRRLRGKNPMRDKAGRSQVVVVHGRGGSGKSRLLRQFQAMAEGVIPGSPVSPGRVCTVFIDWEEEQLKRPALYAGAQGPNVLTVLDVVQRAVLDAYAPDAKARDRAAHAFASYRNGAARMPQYVAGFADVIARSGQARSQFTPDDAAALLKSLVSAGLTLGGHPAGVLGLSPDQLAASAQAAGHLSEAAVRAVTGRKTDEIPLEEYDLVTDPVRELTRRVAAALRTVAASAPLILFLDTGEVIGTAAWGWLRRVMIQSGSRVVWAAGARFETEAEAGAASPVVHFAREIGASCLVLMSPTRFDNEMIADYLADRTPGRGYSDAQIELIARFTKGLPLAVSLAAELLEDGGKVDDVCIEVDDGLPGTVVSGLARRYLVHAERQNYPPDDPRHADLAKILGLGLAYGDLRTDPDLLATLWGTTDPLGAFQDLAQRHDFVLPLARRLHDDVRDTLRTDLLDPYRRQSVRDANQRALSLHEARITDMRVRWPTLDQQLDHAAFTTTLLAILWHTLWTSNEKGLGALFSLLPVLTVADRGTADAAVALADHFAATFSDDQLQDLNLLTNRQRSGDVQRVAHSSSVGLAIEPSAGQENDPLVGNADDRQAAVMILRARLRSNAEAAVADLRAAASSTSSSRLREAIGKDASTIANRIIWPIPEDPFPTRSAPTPTSLAALRIATEMLPGTAAPWIAYADELLEAGEAGQALTVLNTVLTITPSSVWAHSNKALALYKLGRLEEAIPSFNQAIALDPQGGTDVNDRGFVLLNLGRLEEATASFDRAIAIQPFASRYSNRGVTLNLAGRLEDALADFEMALSLTTHLPSLVNKGIVLASLDRLDEALATFDRAVQVSSGEVGEAQVWAGAILWHQGDTDSARNRFAHVLGELIDCTPYWGAQMEAVALCGLGEQDAAERRLIEALPTRGSMDLVAQHLYELLSTPPLPGIDRLRAITEL